MVSVAIAMAITITIAAVGQYTGTLLGLPPQRYEPFGAQEQGRWSQAEVPVVLLAGD